MAKNQTVAIVRDRWQLTIPEEVREALDWLSPSSAITITSEKPNEIVIRPRQEASSVDWEMLWNSIHLVRAFKGKRGNLSAFIACDRQNRL